MHQRRRKSSKKRNPHFFKVIVHSTVDCGQLEMPVEFVRKFGENLSESAVLEVPTGEKWVVGLDKVDGVWFDDGFQGFLEYYKICVGYFLVFRYEGDSRFFVLVLNHDSCEIKYTTEESNVHNFVVKLESEECGEEEDTPASLEKGISIGDSQTRVEKQGERSPTYDGSSGKDKQGKRSSSSSAPSGVKKRGKRIPTCNAQPKDNIQGKRSSLDSGIPVNEPFCPAQKKRKDKPNLSEEEETQRIPTCNAQSRDDKQGKRSCLDSGSPGNEPFCPAQKRRKDKPNSSEEEETDELEPVSQILLRDEYEWAFLRKERPVTKTERERAVCAAKKFKTENPSFMMVMKPSYLRKGLNVPLEFGREHFTEGFHSVKLMLPDGRKTWPARFFLRSTIKALLSGGWNAFARENILLEGDCCVFEVFKKEDIEMKVTLFRVLEDRIPLPRSVTVKTRIPPVIKESKATQEAREFTSENPFYTVYMHQSYARRSGMIMKSDFVKSHMTNEVDKVMLQNTDGTKWSVNCVIKDGAGKFGRGWGPFVKENNIEEGDVCAFELIDKKDNVLKVSIFKNC